MKGGIRAALALGVGYLLGRRREMRFATILAAAATGGLGGLRRIVVKRATKVLGSTEAVGTFAPQLGDLADTVRGGLLDAGKAAAVTNRIESLTGSLHERAEMMRDLAAAASGAGKAARSVGGAARSAGRAARRLPQRGPEAAGAEVADGPKDEEEERYYGEPEEPEGYEPGDGGSGAAPVRRKTPPGTALVSRGWRRCAAGSRSAGLPWPGQGGEPDGTGSEKRPL